MSNQEAIALLRNLEDSLDSYCELSEEGKTAFRMAIEALSSSEIPNSLDTISRKAAIEVVQNRPMMLSKEKVLLINDLEKLPPAQPELKRGRWIYKTDLITAPTGYWECSECKEGRLLYEENFCPNCGANMREVTE